MNQTERTALFNQLHNTYAGLVFHTCYSIVQHPEDAQDASQSTWLKVWQALPTYQPGSPSTWLVTIARHTAIDTLRKRHGIHVALLEEADYHLAFPAPDELIAEMEQAQRALAELNLKQRTIFVLTALLGFSYEETAGRVGKSCESVRGTLARVREQLRSA